MNHYLQRAALALPITSCLQAQAELAAQRAAQPAAVYPELYRYPVPKLGEGGACSLFDELADAPWDIAPALGGACAATDALLTGLQTLLDAVLALMPADWLGVYCRLPGADDDVLLKMAYRGLPSRAEFPLSADFALGSNNSRVGRSGQAVVIDDVRQWQQQGGAYYECDPKVRSEVCLPVLDGEGRVIGILDAEAATPGFFSERYQALLAALACALEAPFAALRAQAKSAAAL